MKMKRTSSKLRAVLSGALSLALITSGVVQSLPAANAAGLPTVRVVTPTFNPLNETSISDELPKYYAAGIKSYFKYVGAGSTITITYLVTSDGTTPAANKKINFMINAPYSSSKATWEADGKTAGASQDSATGYGLLLTGTTNSEGKISFTIKNTDTATTAMAIPASETQARATTGRVYGNIKAVIDGLTDMEQAIDLLTFDITKAAAETLGAPTAAPTVAPKVFPSMRLVSPAYGPSNSVDTTGDIAQYYSAKTRAYYTYIQAGTSLTLKYLVTKDGTAPLANTEVTLQINAPYSMSKANWIVGSAKIGVPASESASGADLKATTNAVGEVTFTIKNTDTTGTEAAPTTPNAAAPKTRLYGTFKPVLTGFGDKDADVDLVTFDVYAAPTVAPKVFPSMRLVSPAYGPSNSVDTTGDIAQYYSAKTRAYYTYIQAGTSLTLKYLVTKDGTAPLANTEVTLQINAPYSMSKANWIVGSAKIGVPASESASGADLKATTNAVGEVTFTIKNTDTTGTEAAPTTPNAAAPKTRLYGTFKPVLTGFGDKDADVDLVTFDVYAAPKPVVKKKTITCVKGKTTKKVTAVKPKCPAGYKKK
jgi:ABC-type transporter lipoprotein component MlaA